MRLFFKSFLVFLATATMFVATAQVEKTPAFPGAEGYGRYVTGGRGGAVYHVTTLADGTQEGTLRWAVNKSGARTVVFDVSGTIHLTSELKIRQGNLTIAGQTAPGDGICIADYPMSIAANNVIVRYMRFRLGNKNVTKGGADGWDGFGGFDQKNLMIDHCSVSWSIDECLSVLGNENTTVQWCMVTHSLVNAGHNKGAHGYGGNWGGHRASFHHNLMAHHGSREPRLGPRPTTQLRELMDMRNNVFYNWGGNGCYGGEGMNVNIVNNYYKPGPATLKRSTLIQQRIAAVGCRTNEYVTTYPDYRPALHLWGKLYVNGNVNSRYSSIENDNWTNGIYAQIDANGNDGTFTATTRDTIKINTPHPFIYTTTHKAALTYSRVTNYAGASLHRDTYDTDIVNDVKKGTATYTGKDLDPGMINSQEDLKPADAGAEWEAWPTLNSAEAPADTDRDGMPDAWETANGLNPNDATDGNKKNAEGYTNLELYLNSLVAAITELQNQGGEPMGDIEYKSDDPTPDPDPDPVSETVYEISGQTSQGNWTFVCDAGTITITPPAGKGCDVAKVNYIKYTRNADYVLQVPEGEKVVKVKVDGYLNGDTGSGYISQLGANTYGATEYPLDNRLVETFKEHTISLATPASETMVLRCGGDNQCALRFYIYTVPVGAAITTVAADKAERADVYSLDGRLMMRHATEQQFQQLPAGLYIHGGKRIVVE